MFKLKLKQLQPNTRRTNNLIRCDRLETLFHVISLFLHKVFLLLSTSFFHVSPHLFTWIQVWRVGRPLSVRSGFGVIWDVFCEPFIRLCFVWWRAIMYKCPVPIA